MARRHSSACGAAHGRTGAGPRRRRKRCPRAAPDPHRRGDGRHRPPRRGAAGVFRRLPAAPAVRRAAELEPDNDDKITAYRGACQRRRAARSTASRRRP
jgi:hypothetical protein